MGISRLLSVHPVAGVTEHETKVWNGSCHRQGSTERGLGQTGLLEACLYHQAPGQAVSPDRSRATTALKLFTSKYEKVKRQMKKW